MTVSAHTGGRRRGRPRRSEAVDSRALILQAAEHEFARVGYDAASIRGIAREAGVDSALVHHYFGDKAGLFGQIANLPVRPDKVLDRALMASDAVLGDSIAREVLGLWERPDSRRRVVAMAKRTLTGPVSRGIARQYLFRELVRRIDRRLGTPDARLRAELAMSQLAGVLVLRYVLAVEPLASEPVEAVVRRIGPVLQEHLFAAVGSGPEGPET